MNYKNIRNYLIPIFHQTPAHINYTKSVSNQNYRGAIIKFTNTRN